MCTTIRIESLSRISYEMFMQKVTENAWNDSAKHIVLVKHSIKKYILILEKAQPKLAWSGASGRALVCGGSPHG